jgi:hypothetical protein
MSLVISVLKVLIVRAPGQLLSVPVPVGGLADLPARGIDCPFFFSSKGLSFSL